MNLPDEFKKMISFLPGLNIDSFLKSMEEKPPVCIRLNKRKSLKDELFEGMRPVKWCQSAYYLEERPEFIFDPRLHAGAYYVQEPSSTIYESITEILSKKLGTGPINVLDACAAPGGKSTAIINGLPDGSFLWANEYDRKRVGALRENLAKWGYPNYYVSNYDTSFFSSGEYRFDIVAVDAPCSGEGMMRKDEFAVRQWSRELVSGCSRLQREILENIIKAIKPGGFLIYSTCTFNHEENEGNVEFMVKDLHLDPVDLSLPKEWGIMSGLDTSYPVLRFMPHATEGEGLFVAVLRKPGEWERTPVYNMETIESAANAKKISLKDNGGKGRPADIEGKRGNERGKKRTRGLEEERIRKGSKDISRQKNCDLTEEELTRRILSIDFDKKEIPVVELDKKTSLAFLRGEAISLGADCEKGHVVVAYGGLTLGAVKNIGARANNLYPKSWRIRKNL